MQFVKFFSYSLLSSIVVTGILVLVAPPLAALTRRIIYGESMPDMERRATAIR